MGGAFDAYEDLPCADFGLLGPLKRSIEYKAIRSRVATPTPVDAWQFDGEHYFVFELRPENDAVTFALFKMRWEDNGPLSALLITPTADGKHAEVRDVRRPDKVHRLLLGG